MFLDARWVQKFVELINRIKLRLILWLLFERLSLIWFKIRRRHSIGYFLFRWYDITAWWLLLFKFVWCLIRQRLLLSWHRSHYIQALIYNWPRKFVGWTFKWIFHNFLMRIRICINLISLRNFIWSFKWILIR